ncbi:MAG: hypothetical protein R3C97_16325 [Geminicoccaceae bacterium]
MSLMMEMSASARIDHGLYIGALFLVEHGLAQKPGHAEHAVHRLAKFVAHGRKEGRARLVGFLGGGDGLFEFGDAREQRLDTLVDAILAAVEVIGTGRRSGRFRGHAASEVRE